jgi:DNA-binding CsgD family transcriptional regulator
VPEETFLQSVIYREHLHKLDVARMCSGIIFDDRSPGVLPTVFSVFRGIRDVQFGTGERAAMRALLPHLSRALGVMFRLRDAELRGAASLAALDSLRCGVALLDRRGRVAYLNRSAREMVRQNDGVGIDHRLSVLTAADPAAQLLLDKAIATAIDRNMIDIPHFSRALAVPRLSGRKPLLLQFAPLGSTSPFAAETGPLAAIAFITEQDRAIRVDARTLKHLYQLTDAEIELAGRLCAGNSLESAARHLGVSASTAKSQLSAIFQKTATHRQAELVRLLISLSSHHT